MTTTLTPEEEKRRESAVAAGLPATPPDPRKVAAEYKIQKEKEADLNRRIENIQDLSPEEQYQTIIEAQQQGIQLTTEPIPEGSKFVKGVIAGEGLSHQDIERISHQTGMSVGGWGYLTPEQQEKISEYKTQLAERSASYSAYQEELKLFRANLRLMPQEFQQAFAVGGVDAYNKVVEEHNAKIAEQKQALSQLSDYRVNIEHRWEGQVMPEVGYDVKQYAEEHPDTYMPTLLTAGFTAQQIDEALRPITYQYDTRALKEVMQPLQFKDEATGRVKDIDAFLAEFPTEERNNKIRELWDNIPVDAQDNLIKANAQWETQRMWEKGVIPVYGTVTLWDELKPYQRGLSIAGDILFLAPVIGVNPLKYIAPGLVVRTPKLATTLATAIGRNVDDTVKVLGGINPNLLKPFKNVTNAAVKYADDFAELTGVRATITSINEQLSKGALSKGTQQYQAALDLLDESTRKLPALARQTEISRNRLLVVAGDYTDELIDTLQPGLGLREKMRQIPTNIVSSVEGIVAPTTAQASGTMALYYRLLAYRQGLPVLEKYLKEVASLGDVKEYNRILKLIQEIKKAIPQLEKDIAYSIKVNYIVEAPQRGMWMPYYGGTATITLPKVTSPSGVTSVELTKTGELPFLAVYAGDKLALMREINAIEKPNPAEIPKVTPTPQVGQPPVSIPLTPVYPIDVTQPGIIQTPEIIQEIEVAPATAIEQATSTEIIPEISTTTAIAPATGIEPAYKPEIATPTKTTIDTPAPPIPTPFAYLEEEEEEEERPVIEKGTIAWRQGIFWIIMPPPYNKRYYQRTPPKGAYKFAIGEDSAYKTIQVIGGMPPRNIENIDIGIALVDIKRTGEDKGLTIHFKQDVEDAYKGKTENYKVPRYSAPRYSTPAYKRSEAGIITLEERPKRIRREDSIFDERTYLGRKTRPADLKVVL